MEAIRVMPHIEKNLAQEILGKRLTADEPKKPAVDVGPILANRACIAGLLPAAISSTKISSDEVFPATAANADAAATAAGCGRTDTSGMRSSPRSPFPSKQSRRLGCGSSVFLRAPARASPGWPKLGLQRIAFAYLFVILKSREPDIGAAHY